MKDPIEKHFSGFDVLKTLSGGIALFLAASPIMWCLSLFIEKIL